MSRTQQLIFTAVAGALAGALVAQLPWTGLAAAQTPLRATTVKRAATPQTVAPSGASASNTAALEQEVAQLRAQLAALSNVVRVASNGDVTIESNTKLVLKARDLEARSQAGTRIEAATALTLKSSATAELSSGAMLKLKSAGTVDVDGSMIQLN